MNPPTFNSDQVIYPLTQAACQLVYLSKTKECSYSNQSICITCPVSGSYLFGDHPSNYNGIGHVTCVFLWFLTILVGMFGILANILIVFILNHKRHRRTFDTLLKGLAGYDALFCVASICTSTASIVYLRKLSIFSGIKYFLRNCSTSSNFQKTGVEIWQHGMHFLEGLMLLWY